MIRPPFLLASFLIVAVFAITGPLPAAEEVDFVKDIKPIFRQRCFACHGALKQESDLRLDAAKFFTSADDGAGVVKAGDAARSELISRVTESDESLRMPPEGQPLSAKEIDLIRQWIDAGAKSAKDDRPEDDPREHWAFQQPRAIDLQSLLHKVQSNNGNSSNHNTADRTKAAASKSLKRLNHPIDLLLEAQRVERGIIANPHVGEIDRRLLLRRVYLDLIGIPPSLDEMRNFINDKHTDAYAKVVDRLLASNHYGERWGRHWMDVWRYTDWYGLGAQVRNSQKHIWHWRDWIIESLNEDMSYRQMVREMLAADEISPTNQSALRATGFLARNYYLFNRTTWLDSTLEHTSKAFLGLTVNCSKCHDHKYDPISHQDYYRMRAIFEPHQIRIDPLPGFLDLEKGGIPRAFDSNVQAKTYLHIRGNEKEPDTTAPLQPDTIAFFNQPINPQPIRLPKTAFRPELQNSVYQTRLETYQSKIDKAKAELQQAKATLQTAKAKEKAKHASRSGTNKPTKPRPTYLEFDFKALNEKQIFLADNFDEPKELGSKKWQSTVGHWSVGEGKLKQSAIGATRRYVRSAKTHPRDFIVEVELTVKGGQQWKSLGINFDVVGEDEVTVYMSAYAQSKLQVSFKQKGKQTYPVAGKLDRPIKLNTRYRLRVAVRDQLVNVSIDGKHQLEFKLPMARKSDSEGYFDLLSFDSIAEFDNLIFAALPADVRLIDGKAKVDSLEVIQKQFELAKATLDLNEKTWRAYKLGFAAELSKLSEKDTDNEDLTETLIAGLIAAQESSVSVVAHSVARLELSQLKPSAKSGNVLAQLNKAKADLAKAKTKLAAVKSDPSKALQSGESHINLPIARKAAENPGEEKKPRLGPFPSTSTGRRAAFADWIVNRRNPLAARVAVNHIWLRHFGQPLVDPVNDFGRRTAAPVQQLLLDWLAVDFMENGWSMKRLHRQIVMSAAYQLAGTQRGLVDDVQISHNHNRDAENDYYWQRIPVRMESQAIRDSLLSLAGTLHEQQGGPTIDPKPGTFRRSLYFRHSRDHQHPFVTMFDDADILRCYRRVESIIPQQSLAMANSKLVFEVAERIEKSISIRTKNEEEFITVAIETILCRAPTPDEINLCREAIRKFQLSESGQSASPAAAVNQTNTNKPESISAAVRAKLIHALLNHNDFITIR